MPAPTESSASPVGMPHTPTAMMMPATSPASEACQAGRRKTPSMTSATAIGTTATRKESSSEFPTGVNGWAYTVPGGNAKVGFILSPEKAYAGEFELLKGDCFDLVRFGLSR